MSAEKKTILIAEDDRVIRELLIVILKAAGYDLVTAVDGVEAVEAFKRNDKKVELIITDIGMPRMNGLEAIVIIREMSKDVPIMILSIWESLEYKQIAEQNNVREYMKKPFDVEEVIRKVHTILPNNSIPGSTIAPAAS